MVVQEATPPNLNTIPLWHPNMISQEASNLVTEDTYYDTDMGVWTPENVLMADISSLHETFKYDADMEHFFRTGSTPLHRQNNYEL